MMLFEFLIYFIIRILVVTCPATEDESDNNKDENLYYVISVTNFPERMVTIGPKGKVRIKDVTRSDFNTNDINIMKMEVLGVKFGFKYQNGYLHQEFGSQVVSGRQLNTLDTGFLFTLVNNDKLEVGDSGKKLESSNKCIKIGKKISASEGWEVISVPCIERTGVIFDVRPVNAEESAPTINSDKIQEHAFGGLGKYNLSGDSALNHRSSTASKFHGPGSSMKAA